MMIAAPEDAGPDAPGPLQRAEGAVALVFARRDGATRAVRRGEAGSARVRLPRTDTGETTAVLINTAGGLAGGDAFSFDVVWQAGAAASVTTQAAERVYRSLGGPARLATRLAVLPGADAAWLPQETILFERSELARRTEIALCGDARLIALEWTVLGRAAMGERVRAGGYRDDWRIRRDGRLVFADAVRLAGDIEGVLAGPATGGGARAFATLVIAGPEAGQGGLLDRLRDAATGAEAVEAGASCPVEGLTCLRAVSHDGRPLRRFLVSLLEALRGRALPRSWMM